MSARDLLRRKACCLSYPGSDEGDRDTDVKAAGTERQSLRSPACHFTFLFVKSSYNNGQESSHREILWQTFITIKGGSF